MSIKCQECNKSFTCKKNLVVHRKDYCSVMRDQLRIELAILTKENLCLSEEVKDLKTQTNTIGLRIISLEIELAEKDVEIQFLKEKNIEAESIKEKLSIAELNVAHKTGKLEIVEALVEKYEDHILKENSKPRNKNNLTFNLAPYNLTKESVEQICSEYTADHFIAGPEATYNFIQNKVIRAEDGRPRVKCVDVSRKIFKGVCEDGTDFMDIGGKKITTSVSAPMKRAVHNAGNLIESLTDNDYNSKVSRHYRVLEPSRLSKRLAGDL